MVAGAFSLAHSILVATQQAFLLVFLTGLDPLELVPLFVQDVLAPGMD